VPVCRRQSRWTRNPSGWTGSMKRRSRATVLMPLTAARRIRREGIRFRASPADIQARPSGPCRGRRWRFAWRPAPQYLSFRHGAGHRGATGGEGVEPSLERSEPDHVRLPLAEKGARATLVLSSRSMPFILRTHDTLTPSASARYGQSAASAACFQALVLWRPASKSRGSLEFQPYRAKMEPRRRACNRPNQERG